jgi:hypothetical protein
MVTVEHQRRILELDYGDLAKGLSKNRRMPRHPFSLHQLLRGFGHIVMSGYGWGDMAINFQLDKWMDDCDPNRIILLNETPEKLVNRSMLLESANDAWTRSGQLICIRHWLGKRWPRWE